MPEVSFSHPTSFAYILLANLSQPRYQKAVYGHLANVRGFEPSNSSEVCMRFNLGKVSENVLRANLQHALLEHNAKSEIAKVTCTIEYILQALISAPRPAPEKQNALADALMRLTFIAHAQWCSADTHPHAVQMVLTRAPGNDEMQAILATINTHAVGF